MTMSTLASAVELARAMGHPARLRTLAMLRWGELCVCQITEVLELAQSTVSSHLRELRRAGLVVERKEGRWVYLSLAAGAEVEAWLAAALAGLDGDDRISADTRVVEELRRVPVEDLCRLGSERARRLAADGGGNAPKETR